MDEDDCELENEHGEEDGDETDSSRNHSMMIQQPSYRKRMPISSVPAYFLVERKGVEEEVVVGVEQLKEQVLQL